MRYLTKILIPYSLPHIITGLRLSIGVAWLVIVAGEMLSGGSGIGFFVWDKHRKHTYRSISAKKRSFLVLFRLQYTPDTLNWGFPNYESIWFRNKKVSILDFWIRRLKHIKPTLIGPFQPKKGLSLSCFDCNTVLTH